MKSLSLIPVVLTAAVILVVQNQVLANEDDYVMIMEEALKMAASKMNISEDQVLVEWELQAKPVGTDFDCVDFGKPSTSPPQSVHQLSPYDVDVVGALGDSVTAAMGAGATCIITDVIEYRGLSWSIGGDKVLSEVTTLPNIIKKYNPNVKGFSIKTGGLKSSNAKFNVAKSGATSYGMKEQAENLVQKMKNDKDVDYENNWKMVTLWIGGNDLCAYCKNKDKYSPAAYIKNIQDALDFLQNEMPRTFVNLVQILDVGHLAGIKGLTCDLVHSLVCKCAVDEQDEVTQASADYQREISKLVESGRYDTRDDFAVVVQPFMIGVKVPSLPNGKPDKSYLAPDCFHFSAKGHREGTIGLWNNMLERVGNKSSEWVPGANLECPTRANPYFYTSKNSVMKYSTSQSSSSDNVGVSSEGQSGPGVNAAGLVTAVVVGVASFAFLAVVVVIVLNCQRKKHQHTTDEKIPLMEKNI